VGRREDKDWRSVQGEILQRVPARCLRPSKCLSKCQLWERKTNEAREEMHFVSFCSQVAHACTVQNKTFMIWSILKEET
jgi:hypothetical protein